MPAKSDFSIRSLIPQRAPKPFHDRRARRGPPGPIVVGGVESRAEISLPVPPLPPTPPHSSPSPSCYPRRRFRESSASPTPNPHLPRRPASPARSRSAAEVRDEDVQPPDTPVYRVASLPCPLPPAGSSAPAPRSEWRAVRPSRPASPLILPPVLAGGPERRTGSIIVPVTVLPAREESASMDETSPVVDGTTATTTTTTPASPAKKTHWGTASGGDAAARKTKRAARRGRSRVRPRRAWTFPENMSELFAVRQLFGRIVADEMLTPEQVDDFRRRREWAAGEEEDGGEKGGGGEGTAAEGGRIPAGGRGSAESGRGWEDEDEGSDGVDGTALEPFRLDALAWRIQAMLGPPPPLPLPPPPPAAIPGALARRGSQRVAHRRPGFSVKRKALPPPRPAGRPAAPDSEIPTPPPRNPARRQLRKKKRMTTFPELWAVARGVGARRAHRKDDHNNNNSNNDKKDHDHDENALGASEDADFVFLPSTPCTLTAPAFRHGRVRIAKADLDPGLGTDGGPMDWTAFQMAILCAGEFPARGPHPDGGGSEWGEREGEEEREEEARGLGEWFGGFGFESGGALRTGEAGGAADRSARSPSMVLSEDEFGSSSSYSVEDEDVDSDGEGEGESEGGEDDLPIPLKTELSPPDHPKGHARAGAPEPAGAGMKEAESGGADAAAHMGYNLGIGLGDFLKWETENVYAVEVP